MTDTGPLAVLTRRAGAVVPRGGRVAAHYGSAAGELALCVRAVGVADRSDLLKFEVKAAPGVLAAAIEALSGFTLSPGGWTVAGDAWWCGVREDRLIAIAQPQRRFGSALDDALRDLETRGAEVVDRTSSWCAIGVVGNSTVDVLSTLGAIRSARAARPFGEALVDGQRVYLLLHSDRRSMVLVHRHAAAKVWRAVVEAGRRYGVGCVGTDAFNRFALVEGRAHKQAIALGG